MSVKEIIYSNSVLGVSFNLYGIEMVEGQDFDETKANIKKEFEKEFRSKIRSKLTTAGLKLVGFNYYSPHTYNYSGDSMDVIITIQNKDILKKFIINNKEKIQKKLDGNTSRDGYIATTVNSIEEELENIKDSNYKPDTLVVNEILEGIINQEDVLEIIFNKCKYVLYHA